MFPETKKSLELLPHTKDALHFYIPRANFQSYVWRKALTPCTSLPDLERSGWYLQDSTNRILKAKLLHNEPISPSYLELLFRSCQKEGSQCSSGKCGCTRSIDIYVFKKDPKEILKINSYYLWSSFILYDELSTILLCTL